MIVPTGLHIQCSKAEDERKIRVVYDLQKVVTRLQTTNRSKVNQTVFSNAKYPYK